MLDDKHLSSLCWWHLEEAAELANYQPLSFKTPQEHVVDEIQMHSKSVIEHCTKH